MFASIFFERHEKPAKTFYEFLSEIFIELSVIWLKVVDQFERHEKPEDDQIDSFPTFGEYSKFGGIFSRTEDE